MAYALRTTFLYPNVCNVKENSNEIEIVELTSEGQGRVPRTRRMVVEFEEKA